MPKFRRLVVPGYPHHVTQRGVRKQTTFFDERDYRIYLSSATALLRTHPVEILAYCLMPNHIHAVVIPQRPDSLSGFFGKLHQHYAKVTNLRYEWAGHLWQNRFFSVVMDERHTMTALRYVERNPVRSGLVKSPQDWPWSSARGNLGLRNDPLIPDRPALRIVKDWHKYVSTPENDLDLRNLRRETGTGRPSGTDQFIARMELLTGRQLRKRSAGRRRKK